MAESQYLPMLRCAVCEKPVLLLTAAQAAQRAEEPEAYCYVCLECESGTSPFDLLDGDG